MLKRAMTILLLLMISCLPISAEEQTNRWIQLPQSFNITRYLDSQTIEYNPNSRIATFWIKAHDDMFPENTTYRLMRFSVNYANKRYNRIEDVMVRNGNVIQQDKAVLPSKKVAPEDFIDLASDIIANRYGIAPVYQISANSWTWVRSTSTESNYIFTDDIDFNKNTNICYTWLKRKYLGSSTPHIEHIKCDFNNRTIGYLGDDSNMFNVLPDTEHETIYNAIHNLCMNKK